MKSENKTPIFLVGCPRSGTTLLQSLLAAHPKICSFPESKFFECLTPTNNYFAKQLGLASRRLKPRMQVFFDEIKRPELLKTMPNSLFARDYPQSFINILNNLTRQQNKKVWIEKTPGHLFCIEEIEHYFPNAKFIHLYRQGTDVAASLYEVTQKYPKAWGGQPWDIERCIDLWIQSMCITNSYMGRSSHLAITYEALVADTRTSMKKLCSFIEVEFSESMILDYQTSSVSLALSQVGRTVNSVIKSKNSEKFHALLSKEQQKITIERIRKSNAHIPISASS